MILGGGVLEGQPLQRDVGHLIHLHHRRLEDRQPHISLRRVGCGVEVGDLLLAIQVPLARLIELLQHVEEEVPVPGLDAVARPLRESDSMSRRIDGRDRDRVGRPVPRPVPEDPRLARLLPLRGPVAVILEGGLVPGRHLAGREETAIRPARKLHRLAVEEQLGHRRRGLAIAVRSHLPEVRDPQRAQIGLHNLPPRLFWKSRQHRRVIHRLEPSHLRPATEPHRLALVVAIGDRSHRGARVFRPQLERVPQLVLAAANVNRRPIHRQVSAPP